MNRWIGLLFLIPFTTLADSQYYCFEPDLEVPNASGRLEKIKAPLIRTDASSEVEACNQAIYLIGTAISGEFDATVCARPFPRGQERCQNAVFRSAMVTGGSLARSQDADCSRPQFFSRVNEAPNPAARQLRLCGSRLSWDPGNREREKFARESQFIELPGQRIRVEAGEPNPLYEEASAR